MGQPGLLDLLAPAGSADHAVLKEFVRHPAHKPRKDHNALKARKARKARKDHNVRKDHKIALIVRLLSSRTKTNS